MKNSLLKNSIFKSILSVCNIIIPLIIGPYVTRLLDIELYGVFNKVTAEFNVFLTIATFGVYTFGVKEISKIRDDKKRVCELFSNLFIISLITNTIIMIIYIIYANLISSGITTIIYMITLILLISNMIYVEYVNEALENYAYITKKTLCVRIIYLICVILMVRNPDDIIIYSVIFCMSTFINNLLSYRYIKKQLKFDFKNLKLKKYIKPLFMVFLITSSEILYFQLDQVLLGKFVNDVAVTIYHIPYLILSRIITVPTSVISVSIPRLSHLISTKGIKEYNEKLNDVLSYFLIMVLPICFGIFVLSKEIILLYAGSKYLESTFVLMAISIIRIIIGLETFMNLLIYYINNKEKDLLKMFFAFGILNVILKIIINSTIGLTPLNAILSTGICYLLLILTEYIYIRKNLKDIKLDVFTKRNIKYFILTLLFIPLSLIIDKLSVSIIIGTILKISICVLLYCGVLLITKDKIFTNVLKKFNIRKLIKR